MGKNIIISELQLERIINRIKESNNSQGSYMAKEQLYTIAIFAYTMWENMKDNEQLEDWMESKIAQTEQNIINVAKSYMYGKFEDNKGMNKLDYDDIVIGK